MEIMIRGGDEVHPEKNKDEDHPSSPSPQPQSLPCEESELHEEKIKMELEENNEKGGGGEVSDMKEPEEGKNTEKKRLREEDQKHSSSLVPPSKKPKISEKEECDGSKIAVKPTGEEQGGKREVSKDPDLRLAFEYFDRNRVGFMKDTDLVSLFLTLGLHLSKSEISDLVNTVSGSKQARTLHYDLLVVT
eukprot:TRINITY_DN4473_c0_g1_i6.p1 TRINITY_DN4473_c0_g1~~TRINITY_DN4473_c0_g1_i6.p1  ORF type:complete len:190 (-),score=64.96 TRINITY_DN4473_c0_g1_i6:278-847(-)